MRLIQVAWLPSRLAGFALPPIGIFLRADQWENALLRGHEMAHWRQYERMGLIGYYACYLALAAWCLFRYGNDWYRWHPMEIEAGL